MDPLDSRDSGSAGGDRRSSAETDHDQGHDHHRRVPHGARLGPHAAGVADGGGGAGDEPSQGTAQQHAGVLAEGAEASYGGTLVKLHVPGGGAPTHYGAIITRPTA